MRRLVILVTSLGILAGSCGERGPGSLGPGPGGPAGTPSGSPTGGAAPPTSPPSGETMTFEVWLARGDRLFVVHRTVPASPRVGTAAVQALLGGPTDEERAAGLTTAVPEGSELLGLTVERGLATADLSGAFASGGGTLSVRMRLAQLVYTLTQFPTVEGVAVELDGRPVEVFSSEGLVLRAPLTREDFADLLPQILVEEPAIGQEVTSPVTIAGTADVFEATVSIRILDARGDEIVRTFTTATCGTGCRGDFEERVRFEVGETQPGTIVVYESSAEDGSPLHVVEIPVVLVA
ncbi:MAG TPA: Gmad2 immunoglobulin-like domain-containing protein [Actinomycetota bacterium]|nr:Gmad2 immunoglobulin-like domain-containing protein [Actinomycetota bacterium]